MIEAVVSGEAEVGFLMYNHLQKKDIKRLLQYKNIELNFLGSDTWYANVGPNSPLYDREEVSGALGIFGIAGKREDVKNIFLFFDV